MTVSARVAQLYRLQKEADLDPPLGYPGGRCYVIERISNSVRSPTERAKLIEKIEGSDKLSDADAEAIYGSKLFERGPVGTQFEKILISIHAQYRMDLRGISVGDLRVAFASFHRSWAEAKGNPKMRGKFLAIEERIQKRQEIEYVDPRIGLTIVFEIGTWKKTERAAVLISCWWSGESDPRPMKREDCSAWDGWSEEYPETPFDRNFPPRVADLNPSLGYPGGPCQVLERIENEVPNERAKESLKDQVESGKDLSNAEASRIYKLEIEKGPVGTRFNQMALSSHAQYRMDFRGVNVADLKIFFIRFQKAWNDSRSLKGTMAKAWDQAIMYGDEIEWTDSGGLTVVFTVKDKTAKIITTYWKGIPDPRPMFEDSCNLPKRVLARFLIRRALKMAPEPGVTTFVRDDSAKGLPTDLDRTKEQALPLPGSATPGGAGRNVPTFSYNTPSDGATSRPRTLSIPGEDAGSPTKFDYGTPTRRSLTSASELLGAGWVVL